MYLKKERDVLLGVYLGSKSGEVLPYKMWGRIFTTGLTIMCSHFQQSLLEWGRTFSDFWSK